MIKIFPTSSIQSLDNYTIAHEPISQTDLVERAAMVFVAEFSRRFSKQNRIVVFAGQGNNGADGLAIARLLADASYRVEVFLFNPTARLSESCEINKERIQELDHIEFTEVSSQFAAPDLTEQDILIDGLFGSGITRPLSGGFAAVVDYVNQSDATVVSIDIPSGLFGEDNRKNNPDTIIRANYTFTFAFPKLAFFFPENAEFVGEWKVLDILLHPDVIDQTSTPYIQITESDIAAVFQPRSRFAHKGNFGHALLIAGSRGKMGAAVISSRACLRSGVGLLTVHIPQRGEQVLQTAVPEAMITIDANADCFTEITDDLSVYAAIGLGPGLGQQLETAIGLESLLNPEGKPMVIDADALNLIAANNELLRKLPKRSILTPHPKEFDRLAGESTSSYERLMKAQQFAIDHQVCLILKGAYTATCTPSGNIYINNCGNPGMATAGSGDALTGIILGLLAQGYEPETASVAGVFLHATAGDLAAIYNSEESMIAEDIISMLGKVFKQIR